MSMVFTDVVVFEVLVLKAVSNLLDGIDVRSVTPAIDQFDQFESNASN